ncbi:unnamed protein product [Closterium sp. NIES-53]
MLLRTNAQTTRSLAYNQLSGPIPTSIGSLATLTYLDLSSNQLSGPIPEEIGAMLALTRLSVTLHHHKLVGFPFSTLA